MNVLAIDTATEACSLALSINGEVLARHQIVGRDHTASLLPVAHRLMADAGLRFSQLDGLVCGIGPGSFAGVRIGLGWVKGLALANDLPVAAVSTLAVLAQGALRRGGAHLVLSSIDARMNEVYFAQYRRGADGLAKLEGSEQVCPPESLTVTGLRPWIACGSGWKTYAEVLLPRISSAPVTMEVDALPEARDALSLGLPVLQAGAGSSADHLVPSYLRNQVAKTLLEQVEARRQKQQSQSEQ